MRPQSTSPGAEVWRLVIHQDLSRTVSASAQSSIEERLTGTVFREAKKTVISAEMGTSKGNAMIDAALDKLIPNDRRVLIGGPPCQAYSLVGRARNAGKADYDPKADHRNYLYTEYLRVLEKISPAIFVMENVKGINSAKIEGQSIVGKILRDLADPGKAVSGKTAATYHLYSLASNVPAQTGLLGPTQLNPKDFVIRCEDYGIPQARHRVIIFGVRSDIDTQPSTLKKSEKQVTVRNTIEMLPKLRSGFTDKSLKDTQFASVLTRSINSLIRRQRRPEHKSISLWPRHIKNNSSGLIFRLWSL